MHESKVKNIYLYILAVVALLVALTFYALSRSDGLVHVYFLNIGQGDSIFIQNANGNQILIDGGPDTSVLNELGAVMPFWDRSIDMLVMTHPDADHINGLLDVLEKYEVKRVIETGVDCKTAQCVMWNNLVDKEKAKREFVWLGHIIDTGGGLVFEVLNPFTLQKGEIVTDKNNTSIVMKVVYGENELLLAGDIEEKIERKLALAGVDIDSDFLKAAHHGSKTSSSDIFLKTVTPELAFISAGLKNRYGHPAPVVLQRLESHGIMYYRTDTDKRIELILDKTNYQVKTQNN